MTTALSPSTAKQAGPSELHQRAVAKIFDRMLHAYGAKWADLWRDTEIAKVQAFWVKELAGFSLDEIAAGVAACRSRDWPPTLPEFMKACRPPLDPALSWLQAQEGARARDRGEVGFTDARLFEAFRRMAYDVRRGAEFAGAIAERWAATLKHVDADIAAGQVFEITPPAKALPAPPPLSREEAQRRVAELRLRFGRNGRLEREPEPEDAQQNGNEE